MLVVVSTHEVGDCWVNYIACSNVLWLRATQSLSKATTSWPPEWLSYDKINGREVFGSQSHEQHVLTNAPDEFVPQMAVCWIC